MLSESAVMSAVRLEAAAKGILLMRNNVGVLRNQDGVPVRYGLMNETAAMNRSIKSSDLIGIRRVVITPDMVGKTIGQFIARECKHGGWELNPRDSHELAQWEFIRLVGSYGGDAAFTTGKGTL